MSFYIKNFDELTTNELYQALKLRYDVFVVEQNCIYNEFDDIDYHALHIFYHNKGKIIAYCRLYQKSENTASLGRIVVDKRNRNSGLGKKIILDAIDYVNQNWSLMNEITISAQFHLKNYYETFGFEQVFEAYDDGGIPHIDMLMKINN